MHRSASSTTAITSTNLGSRHGDTTGLCVGLTDHDLRTLAEETRHQIEWGRILHHTASPSEAHQDDEQHPSSHWRRHEVHGGMTVFIKDDPQRFAVLATGVIPCAPHEVTRLLESRHSYHFQQRMEAIFGDQFVAGGHLTEVAVDDVDGSHPQVRSTPMKKTDLAGALTQLTVKHAAFAKTSWRGQGDAWVYADAVYQHPTSEHMERLMTTIPIDGLGVDGATGAGVKSPPARFHQNVLAGYLILPEVSNMQVDSDGGGATARRETMVTLATRVHFYAEHRIPSASETAARTSKAAAVPVTVCPATATRERLLRMARSCVRFEQLIRRRRLGGQVQIDLNRFFPPTHCRCARCNRALLFAKLCGLCGFAVCERCSSKHEREREVRGSVRLQVDLIRVCEACLDRVDYANYTYVTSAVPMRPVIQPDARGDPTPGVRLQKLLREALDQAPAEKKTPVLAVIRAILDQDHDDGRRSTDSRERASTSSTSSFDSTSNPLCVSGIGNRRVPDSDEKAPSDDLAALAQWDLPSLPEPELKLAQCDTRTYQLDMSRPQGAFPTNDSEATRLAVLRAWESRALGHSEELNLVCQLAMTEMQCFASMVALIDEHDVFVMASSDAAFELQSFPREESICAHTIMDTAPHVIPHPEADARFHRAAIFHDMGIKYYCGFPLLGGEDNATVIGSMCCVNNESRGMTAAQYTALKRLAATASKIIRVQGERQRKKSLSATSTRPVAPTA